MVWLALLLMASLILYTTQPCSLTCGQWCTKFLEVCLVSQHLSVSWSGRLDGMSLHCSHENVLVTSAGLGFTAAAKKFVQVFGITWAGSQLTKVWHPRSGSSPCQTSLHKYLAGRKSVLWMPFNLPLCVTVNEFGCLPSFNLRGSPMFQLQS